MSSTSFLPSQRRKLKRRFSSVSPGAHGWSYNAVQSLTLGSAIAKRRGRQVSLSPPATTLGLPSYRPFVADESDTEDEIFDLSESIRSAPSHRHLYHKDLEPSKPLLYSSLPPTPVSASPPPHPFDSEEIPLSPTFESELAAVAAATSSTSAPTVSAPFSLWDYLREELLATDFDSHQELKWERVSNFLSIPLAMEKIIGFGFIVCLDSFLYTFTILPIRFAFAFFRLFTNIFRSSPPPLPPSQKADILRALLLVVSVLILNPLTDASKIYHTIRGQDTIKLYVIFNALEIADRLCASIGQDIIDCLFSRSTLEPLSHRIPVTTHTFRPILFFTLATLYNVAHALVMVYQLISLNVAINSYDHALLTLLVSNQFVEIKGSVFKKFEKDNLFQITCADIVERFTLALMLFVVAFRNLIELSGSEFDFSEGFVLPKSWFRGNNVLWTISYPVVTVMMSEMLVDWLKHAFITKFNHIRPSVYERYTDVLCRDLASGSAVGRRGARKHTYVDQSPLVARRLGFAALPLAVLAILVGSQSLNLMFAVNSDFSSLWTVPSLSNAEIMHYLTWAAMGVLFWLCFLVIKIILGVNLISYATRRRAGMEAREAADAVNDFGRDPIGEGKEEQVYNKKLKTLLDNDRDDAPRTAEIGENQPGQQGKKGRVKLEDLTRYTMVKRIW
ncbi:Endoplasmic reticulum membrane protein 65 [Hypsizygus marmoreus]|uniref:Endoplasmic reticulum membrane protein 65 n=1 Tax=Hypsizygus marmoreus TaxID=39966 RepID=A0A369J834_HYPMA|nr:Endoplasmic reticulum membrane protein 65 [Hypsizygus marmoreus]